MNTLRPAHFAQRPRVAATRSGALTIALTLLLATPAAAHENYDDWKSPSGASCCNQHDCDVVEIVFRDGERFVVWRGREYAAPNATLVNHLRRDGKPAACVWGGVVRCLSIGGQT